MRIKEQRHIHGIGKNTKIDVYLLHKVGLLDSNVPSNDIAMEVFNFRNYFHSKEKRRQTYTSWVFKDDVRAMLMRWRKLDSYMQAMKRTRLCTVLCM
nr:unnamed protein product [Callosobruchus chinensis]